MKNKFLCIHGHFYQPPRENPWLETIEPEESAHPYPNWNEKIFQECYGPNSACPVLGEDGLIADMADNYRAMSFNFGPTLMSWIEREHPLVHEAIVNADQESCAEFDGHGNAIAQPYYHAILPLQTRHDKTTLVRWGIADFKRRFGRDPEGLWLPETGVDEETLEVLIEEGIKFTILAPSQAARVRDVGAADWKEVDEENLFPTRPYRWVSREDAGKNIALFFYHGKLHEAVVKGQAFKSDHDLLHKMIGRFLPDDSTQLVSLAVDGEFFGHHHRAGAAALAQTVRLARASGVALTNYAHYLSRFPPPQEVELKAKTAWSCEHGLGRWNADCGCRHKKNTSQAWRAPLREALDWLAARLDKLYAEKAGDYLRDYLAARDAYAERLADPSPENAERFLKEHGLPGLDPEAYRLALALLEMQRWRLAMFTSCGWFFDDVAGIEAAQCLKAAARALELAEPFGQELAAEFKERLAKAPGNHKKLRDAAKVFETLVETCRADLPRALANFALLRHLGLPWENAGPALSAELIDGSGLLREEAAGRDRSLSYGTWRLRHFPTLGDLKAVALVHQGDRVDLRCWVGQGNLEQAEKLLELFENMNKDEFDREMSRLSGGVHFGLDALFTTARFNAMRALMPAPMEPRPRKLFREAWSDFVARLMRGETVDDQILACLEDARALKFAPDQLPWISEVRAYLRRVLEAVLLEPSPENLSRAARWTDAFEKAGIHSDVWELQQFAWRWRAKLAEAGAAPGEGAAAAALAEKLGFSSSLFRGEAARL